MSQLAFNEGGDPIELPPAAYTAIARLRAALPPGANVPAPSPLRFQLVPLHHLERSK